MGKNNLVDSELKVMTVLWENGNGPMPARQIAGELEARYGWNVNTTYTLIKRCIGKGTISRSEPNFMCRALLSREDAQRQGTRDLVDKIFDGSVNKLFASLLGKKEMSNDQIERLKKMVDDLDD